MQIGLRPHFPQDRRHSRVAISNGFELSSGAGTTGAERLLALMEADASSASRTHFRNDDELHRDDRPRLQDGNDICR